MTDLLSCRGLSVAYRSQGRDVRALSEVDLVVQAGETVGVVGASGSGKSTLALAVMNYLGRGGRIAAGSVSFEGTDIASLDAAGLRALRGGGIGMVYQDPLSALNPAMRVGAQLAEIADGGGSDVLRALAEMKIPDPERVARSYPHQLSGGQLQRAVVAMALLAEPKLLILDEPTSSLDATVSAEISELLQVQARKRRMAMLLISHDLGMISTLCGQAVALDDGRVVERGETATVLADPQSEAVKGLVAAWRGLKPRYAAPPETAPVLRIQDLRKTYKNNNVEALGGVSFDIRAGETVAVIGESGAGKTTLAALSAGLDTPDGGAIWLLDQDVAKAPLRRRPASLRAALQMVFQHPSETLNPARSVGSQLLRALKKAGKGAEELEPLMESVGLAVELADRRPDRLSGGQQQRAAIARALALSPSLLIADEPLSALDPPLRNAILNLLISLQKKHGIAVLLITHDLVAARAVADRVVVLKDGETVEQGPASRVFETPVHPYTKALIDASRTGGV